MKRSGGFGLEKNTKRDIGNSWIFKEAPFLKNQSRSRADDNQGEPRFHHDFSSISVHEPAQYAIQPKMAVSRPGDQHERVADQVAEQITAESFSPPQKSGLCGPCPLPESTGAFDLRNAVQRQAKTEPVEYTEDATEPDAGEVLQTKSLSGKSPRLPTGVREYLAGNAGRGEPLPQKTREFMERRFGVDFGRVRVHTNAESAGVADAVRARAFTYKNDVYFGAGEYHPETRSGQFLLAHELTHVLQQSGHVARAAQTNPPLRVSPCTGEIIQRSEALYFSTHGKQGYFRYAERFHREHGFPAPVRVSSVEEMLENMASLSMPINHIRIVSHAVPAGIYLPLFRGGTSSLFQGDMALQSMESMELELGSAHPTVRARGAYRVEERNYHLVPEDWVRQAWLEINWTRGGPDVLIRHRYLLGNAPQAVPGGPLPDIEMHSFFWWLLDRELLMAQRDQADRRGRVRRQYVLNIPASRRRMLLQMYNNNIRIFRNRLMPAWGSQESFDLLEAMIVQVATRLIDRALQRGISVNITFPEQRYRSVAGAVERGTYPNNLLRAKFGLADGADLQIRGCRIGQNASWLEAFRDFFGHGAGERRSRPHVSAPMLRHAFGIRGRRVGRRSVTESVEWLQDGRKKYFPDNPKFEENIRHVR